MRRNKKEQEKVEIPISPMIDCVFLLLIYFLVSSTMLKQEGSLSFQLPGTITQSSPLEIPDEQIIEIKSNGQIVVNEFQYDSPASTSFPELKNLLTQFKQTCDSNQVASTITIAPEDSSHFDSIVKVMDACSSANITSIHFSLQDETL
tara:strand:+ start:672 stop:1115 length:444 start_codon:yes stop_codon:yes gene_type:complete